MLTQCYDSLNFPRDLTLKTQPIYLFLYILVKSSPNTEYDNKRI